MSIANKQKFFPSLALLYGAVCWGVIWYPYRLLNALGMAGVASSFYSYLLALAIGALLFMRRWRHVPHIPASALLLCLVAGWTNLSYVMAVIDGEVMRVMLLFYLSPLWTLLLAKWWLREPLQSHRLMAIVLSMAGAWLMLTKGTAIWPLPQSTAEWLALSSGMGFSLTNVMTRRAEHLSVAAKSMLVWLGVAMMAGLLLIFKPDTIFLQTVTTQQWLYLAAIALLLCSATLLVQYGVTKIPAIEASILFMFELIVAGFAAYYLAGESMVWAEWLGGGLIIGAGLLSSLFDNNTNANTEPDTQHA